MWRWLAGYSCGVCRGEGVAVDVEIDYMSTKEISQEQNTTNIIVLLLE